MTARLVLVVAAACALAGCGCGESHGRDDAGVTDAATVVDGYLRIPCRDPRCRNGCCRDFDGGTYCCGHSRCSEEEQRCYCGSGPVCPYDKFCCGERGLEMEEVGVRCTPDRGLFDEYCIPDDF